MRIEPLAVGFGASVHDFDLHEGRMPDDIIRLQEAYDVHHLLLFRGNGTLVPQRQVEIAGWFGPVGANRDAHGNPWTVLDNEEPTGALPLPFHADISFMAHPIEGLSLHPLALPEGPTVTSFVSNALAWEALPAAAQARLDGRSAAHRYEAPPEMKLPWPVLSHHHPACLRHPRTGRRLLFVSENHVSAIDGLDDAEGEALLTQCFEALYAPERRYDHIWKLGDLLVWNNLALQHGRPEAAPPTQGARILQRVAIGTHNFPDQLAALAQPG
jgi:taurine dioxygenase